MPRRQCSVLQVPPWCTQTTELLSRSVASGSLPFFFSIKASESDPYLIFMQTTDQRGFDIGRVQSCVLRLPKYWPPTRRVCPSPATKAGESGIQLHNRRAERGVGVNILEDARHRIGLLRSSLYATGSASTESTQTRRVSKNYKYLGELGEKR
jgi:hypothetical protein